MTAVDMVRLELAHARNRLARAMDAYRRDPHSPVFDRLRTDAEADVEMWLSALERAEVAEIRAAHPLLSVAAPDGLPKRSPVEGSTA